MFVQCLGVRRKGSSRCRYFDVPLSKDTKGGVCFYQFQGQDTPVSKKCRNASVSPGFTLIINLLVVSRRFKHVFGFTRFATIHVDQWLSRGLKLPTSQSICTEVQKNLRAILPQVRGLNLALNHLKAGSESRNELELPSATDLRLFDLTNHSSLSEDHCVQLDVEAGWLYKIVR